MRRYAAAAVFVLFAASAQGEEHAAVTITNDNFGAIIRKGVVLVDFWAAWCPPCRKQGPVVEKVAAQFKGRAVVGKLDVDKAGKIAGKLKVKAIPTLIIFKDGKEIKRLVGFTNLKELASELEKALK